MKRFSILLALAGLLLLTGCQSYKKVPYIKNSKEVDLTMATQLYDAKILPKDVLTITVNCPNSPEAAKPFNLTIQASPYETTGGRTTLTSQQTLQQYVVSNDGIIDFPILGQIKVVGMTKVELENYIADKIYGTHLKERPIVTVTVASFKVSVIGEVNRSGQYTVSTGKVNIFEALALAGDMTIYGMRDNVKVIRENSLGEKNIVELNLNDANIINSPYYQLQQNDIVYVTPNKAKAKGSGIGSETSLWFSSVGILISITSLIYSIVN